MKIITRVFNESLWLRSPSEELGSKLGKLGNFFKRYSVSIFFSNLQQYMVELCNHFPFLFKAAFPRSHSALQK